TQPKCCYKITTVFSHAQTVVLCVGCSTVLCQPTGGKARLTEGGSELRRQHLYSWRDGLNLGTQKQHQ
uniref:40S ribosomal protein S27 n=1 Tax=Coturnix japonica TaxID=93934 RepID=A0A8C2TUW1_COTJA